MKCPTEYSTQRLRLRRPAMSDAPEVFSAYASDRSIGQYLAWPIHESVDDSRDFVTFSDAAWRTAPGGPYLVFHKEDGALIGSTGLAFESDDCASTGYVIARTYWGRGFATEALRAITELSAAVRLERLYALCHPANAASIKVLQKCDFEREANPGAACVFPNSGIAAPQAVESYVWRGQPTE